MTLHVNDVRVCRCSFWVLDKAVFAASGKEQRALADPTTISLVVTAPGGAQTTYTYPGTIVRQSLGAFTQDVPLTATGTWTAVWTGTGAAAGAEPDEWIVA